MSAATPTIRRGFSLTSMNFITGSVKKMWRFTAAWLGNMRCARLWLMMTTISVSRRSLSLKSRPANSGEPRAAKNLGEIARICALGSVAPGALTCPSAENSNPDPNELASRHGTTVPAATPSTPGNSRTLRRVSL